MTIQNKDGKRRRTPTDNQVIKSAGQVRYKNNVIDFISILSKWELNGETVGSISQLSMDLYKITGDDEFNLTTYKIGRFLEDSGYIFRRNFHDQNISKNLT